MSEEKKDAETRRDGDAEIKEQRDLLFEAVVDALVFDLGPRETAKLAAVALDLFAVVRGEPASDVLAEHLRKLMERGSGKAVAS